jgi:hypothetical protein
MEPVKAERIPLKRSDGRDAQETTHPTVVVMAVQTSWRGCAQSLSALRFFELVSDDVVAAGCRRAEPTTMNQATSASEARRLWTNRVPLRLQTSCLCNQLEFLRYLVGCYLLWLGRRMRLP